jgi:hypothetical protein
VLYAVPYAGGSPTALGTIIDTSDSQPQRIDGLAMSGGILYGSYAASTAEDGLWQIDVNTLQATLIAPFSDSISGIDADPATGVIYGVNDTTGQLVTIATDGTITNVAPYPDGFDDIDGLAVGNGFAYLVIDEAGSFPVYDLVNEVYVTALTSPFTAADTFAGAAIALSAATSRATFAVTKDFTDDNPAGVEVTISCNTGLPLEQSKVITEGESVEFVVVDFDNGEMDCEVTEEVPAGYGAEYFDGATTSSASCEFLDIEFGSEFSCQITNTPGPVDVVIHKEWVFEGSSDPQGIDQRYDLTLFCDAEIVDGIEVGPFQEAPAGNGPPCGLIALPGQDGPQGFADWCKAFFGEGPDTFVAEVIPEFPDSHCFVIERLFDSAVEVDNGCRNITVSAGNGAECTITNTVFFEGIPTLTQYGLALLALLMLGVGFIGFRRFA